MNPNRPYDPDDTRRMMMAMFLLGIGLLVWHFVYEYPRQQAAQKHAMEVMAKEKAQLATLEEKQKAESVVAHKVAAKMPKIKIDAPEMQGQIALHGGRFNGLSLTHFAQKAKKNSPPVELLKPSNAPDAFFVEFGWISPDSSVKVPQSNTLWQSDSKTLLPDKSVTLFWENDQKIRFELVIARKDAYLFNVQQRVINNGKKAVSLLPYGYINRSLLDHDLNDLVSHEGPIGVMDGSLKELKYKDLIAEGKVVQQNATGWLGISDKYWLTALIPQNDQTYTGNFKAYLGKDALAHRYQADFMGKAVEVAAGATGSYQAMLFAGAKKMQMLDEYAAKYQIPLFDRAVDLGWFYFLTKPLFTLLHMLYVFAGDFGLAILLLTVLVKLAMYPLANKSFVSMNEMKRLQPKMVELKERCGADKVKYQQEIMKLYKQEKINPAAGCLPMLIQMPVFFALYKVFYVTIEMRHANFFGIIRDLSAQDPTNLFTGFGLIDWNPPSLLTLGIMPILFACSMVAQQRMSPKPTDPAQAKAMQFLPWIFMFIMAHFPAGLLLYWIWSNMISIAQQWNIKRRYEKRSEKRNALAANDA
jgi:YidC/Oxa1 family membrane protein insertase